jgi:hypothetical protein
MTPDRFVRILRIAALAASAAGIAVALGPIHPPDGMDKLLHMACFYAYALLVLAAFPRRRKTDLAVGLLLIGAASEFAQAMTGRDGSVGDFAADAAGIACAVGPIWVARFRQLARAHPYTTFARLRQDDRRGGILRRPSAARDARALETRRA